MTDPIDFLIEDQNGQHSITITPVNVTLANGILYATGEYALSEGEVGIGTIVFNADHEWSFDGVTDVNEHDIKNIVAFIRKTDSIPDPLTDKEEPEIISGGGTVSEPTPSHEITFIVQDNGQPVDVHVEINYPVYNVTMGGRPVAQLEQDHHSNWFVASGRLSDPLVQEIGKRIVEFITA